MAVSLVERCRRHPNVKSMHPEFPRSEPLMEELKRRTSAEGKITFADFMQIVLYHPKHGYYTNRDREPWNDYVTSPDVHPAFGKLVTVQLREMYETLGSPKKFDILEVGAGRGTLAQEVLTETEKFAPTFFDALNYTLSDVSPLARIEQSKRLERFAEWGKIKWIDDASDKFPVVDGCILTNELLDSFPVHRVVSTSQGLREVSIELRNGRLEESLDQPSTEALHEYFRYIGLSLRRGCVAEVNLEAVKWLKKAAAALRRGFILTADYGYEARELFSPRRRAGSLVCYHNGQWCPYPFIRLGYQDITSHVDFTTLIRRGEEIGLELTGITTQRNFLINLGIVEFMQEIVKHEASDPRGCMAHISAINKLLDERGLGKHRVLIQHKGTGKPQLKGLRRVPRRQADFFQQALKALEKKASERISQSL
ncbi:MAG: class I SAM-dependent methyltransferase [Candidatus Bathyarchaeia archaeon]